jgi:hypothetical protein
LLTKNIFFNGERILSGEVVFIDIKDPRITLAHVNNLGHALRFELALLVEVNDMHLEGADVIKLGKRDGEAARGPIFHHRHLELVILDGNFHLAVLAINAAIHLVGRIFVELIAPPARDPDNLIAQSLENRCENPIGDIGKAHDFGLIEIVVVDLGSQFNSFLDIGSGIRINI